MNMPNDDKVYFGFSPDYGEIGGPRPTVAFFGRRRSLASFGEWLEKLEKRHDNHEIRFSGNNLFTRGQFDIILHLLPNPTGMKKINDNTLEWGLSGKELKLFADELKGFGQGSDEGSATWKYFDCDTLDEVQVVATTGDGHYRKSEFI